MIKVPGMQFFLDALPDAVLVCDEEGMILQANRQCEKLLGYSPDELVGLSVDTLVPAELRHRHAGLRQHYRRSPQDRSMQSLQHLEALCKDGSHLPVTIALNALKLDAMFKLDDHQLVIVSLRDNTAAVELRKRERQQFDIALKTQRLENLGMLSTGIAHDFKNLLTVVLGNAELALMHMDEHKGSVRESLLAIRSATLRLQQFSLLMLRYANGNDSERSMLDLNAAAREMGTMLRVSLPPGIALRYALAPALPSFPADPVQVSQVLLNLVLNASEAIGARDGTITLHTGAEEAYVFVAVQDDGLGIDDKVRHRILDDFFTTKTDGIGMGLPVVNAIVKRHGGFLRIDSRAGKGSMFSVYFPLLSATAA